MDKVIKSKISKRKQALIVFGVVIITPIISLFLAQPVLDIIEKNKFAKLDTNINEIYKEIKAVAGSDEDWKYVKECSDDGDWITTNTFFCHATISMKKTITTAKEIGDLQKKYFSIIDKNQNLEEKTNLSVSPSNFGESFEISSAEKHYIEKNTNIECWYLNKLSQTTDSYKTLNFRYGSMIEGGAGNASISLNCTAKARYYWYGPDERLKMFVQN